MQTAEFLHERTSLLKLAQGGGVEPDVTVSLTHFFAKCLPRLSLPAHHEFHLAIEKGGDVATEYHQINNE